MTPVLRLSALAAAALLTACAVPLTPDAEDALPRPGPFQHADTLAAAAGGAPGWDVFGDPRLDELLREGLQANLDLRQAAERVRRAQALADGARAASRPAVHFGADFRDEQASAHQAPGLPDADARRRESASAAVTWSWELDLFGRLAAGRAAAAERAAASQADADALRLSVAGRIAHTWFALEGAREQRRIAIEVLANRRATRDLVAHRLRAGAATALDEARARADLAAAEAELPALDAEVGAVTHRLAVLLGRSPSGYVAPASADRPLRPVALTLPDPQAWAAARPDLRAAEATLRAQRLDVQAVRAEFLPRVSITGALGLVAGSLSGLGAVGSTAWFIAPALGGPVFDGGRIEARLQSARAGQREAMLAYHQRLLLATEEVETALARVGRDQARVAAWMDGAAQAQRAQRLARERFAAGASDLLELLDAQRQAHLAQRHLASAVTEHRQRLADLQRALGRGPDPTAGVAGATSTAGG